jgi:hypothetical protein
MYSAPHRAIVGTICGEPNPHDPLPCRALGADVEEVLYTKPHFFRRMPPNLFRSEYRETRKVSQPIPYTKPHFLFSTIRKYGSTLQRKLGSYAGGMEPC